MSWFPWDSCISESMWKGIELHEPVVIVSLYHREMKENNGLLKEEVEGLQRKLERYEKVQAQLVTVELENEVRSWEHLVCEQNRSFLSCLSWLLGSCIVLLKIWYLL